MWQVRGWKMAQSIETPWPSQTAHSGKKNQFHVTNWTTASLSFYKHGKTDFLKHTKSYFLEVGRVLLLACRNSGCARYVWRLGSALHCGSWQRTLTSLCSKLVRENLWSQHAGPWAQPAGGGERSTVCTADCCASSLRPYAKSLVAYCHQIVP